MRRRHVLQGTLALLTGEGLSRNACAGQAGHPSGLLFPQSQVPGFLEAPSPPVRPFVDPLPVMPIASPVSAAILARHGGPPDPQRHQRFQEFPPRRFYIERLREFVQRYHTDPPYARGSWTWGFSAGADGGGEPVSPGPTYHARYGEPVFVRRINELPATGAARVRFALPSTTIHLHNAHTASESDGIPVDFVDTGEFWDHHYGNFPAGDPSGRDVTERLTTLWYHDHRMDFTAPNIYAGLTGFYLLFDEFDSNNERDGDPRAFRLPSGRYDVPLMLHDIRFDQQGQLAWDFLDTGYERSARGIMGMLGDRFTVNRKIQPYLTVEPRKYRLRLLNGGPSRLYRLSIEHKERSLPFHVITVEGNLLPEPIRQSDLELWVAQRNDIVVDFSGIQPGEQLYLVNRLQMRTDGAGPTGRELDQGDLIMRFDVTAPKSGGVEDPSRIPDVLRPLPAVDPSAARRERLFVFDLTNGIWTINGRMMDPARIDARIEQGSAEIWTLRNAGDGWAHPVHSHFEEFRIIERNGRPIPPDTLEYGRKDVAALGPNDEIKVLCRWRDFLGRHVMHCHNVVHEDHAMMIRWDIVPPGQGD